MGKKGMTDVDIALTVSGISGNRTTLLDELTDGEIELLIKIYTPLTQAQQIEAMQNKHVLKQLRSDILKDAQILGIYTPGDWTSFNRFMLHRSVLKKPLKDYKIEEFKELNKQFKAMVTKYKKRSRIAGTKEWHQVNKFPIPSKN